MYIYYIIYIYNIYYIYIYLLYCTIGVFFHEHSQLTGQQEKGEGILGIYEEFFQL